MGTRGYRPRTGTCTTSPRSVTEKKNRIVKNSWDFYTSNDYIFPSESAIAWTWFLFYSVQTRADYPFGWKVYIFYMFINGLCTNIYRYTTLRLITLKSIFKIYQLKSWSKVTTVVYQSRPIYKNVHITSH